MDPNGVQARIVGQHHSGRRALAARAGVSIDEVTHRAEMGSVLSQRSGDRRFERAGAMAFEQSQEAAREYAQMRAPSRGAQEQRLGAGRGVMQPILRPLCPTSSLVRNQSIEMIGHLDLLSAIEAARVTREQCLVVEDAHGLKGREHGERAPHMGMRNAVIVQVESRVRRLADIDCGSFLGRAFLTGYSRFRTFRDARAQEGVADNAVVPSPAELELV